MSIVFDVQEYWDLSDACDALESALHATSDAIAEFEKAFASFIGELDAVFLISGREALYQALDLIGAGDGDEEVILSAFNCSRLPDAALRRRAVPVIVDVRLPGGEIDLAQVRQALSPKTRAVVVPHLYGISVDFRGLAQELSPRGVIVIEDCAHCVGGTIGGKTAGGLGAFSIFSFNTGKPITLGNGGMLVCSDPNWLDRFRRQKMQLKQDYSTDAREEFEFIKTTLDAMACLRAQAGQGRLIQKPLVWAGRWPFLNYVPRLVGRLPNGTGLPNMRRMASQSLTLPVHQDMNREHLDRMIDMLRSVSSKNHIRCAAMPIFQFKTFTSL